MLSQRKTWKRWVREGALMAAFTFLFLEIGLRVLPWMVGDPLKSFIEEAGRIPLSNLRTYSGFTGGTRRLLPPTHETDVLVVGDSVPFGTYVREEDAFPAQLASMTGSKVLNIATASQSPPQYNRMLELGLRYRPKLVLYCLFANDFAYGTPVEARPLSAETELGSGPEDHSLYLSDLSPSERAANLVKRLTNLSLAYQLRKLFQQPFAQINTVNWGQKGMSFVFAPTSYWDDLLNWERPVVREGVTINTRLIEAAHELTEKSKIRLLVVLVPSKEMVYGPYVGERIYRDAHHETYRRLRAELEERKIDALDLTYELRRIANLHVKLFHTIDGHLNEEGHRRVAGLLNEVVAGTIRSLASPGR